MLPVAKVPRREGMKAVEKLCRGAIGSSSSSSSLSDARALSTASGGDTARRHQAHLHSTDHNQTEAASAAPAASTASAEQRGGPKLLDQLHLRVLAKNDHFLVLNKGEDHRLDGEFDATIEKALHRDFPSIDKFRWIHQLDFATSGVMCIGLEKEATALACKLFREKRVQKEYLAVVRGHLPFDPRELRSASASATPRHIRACTFSKLGLLIQDTEQFDRLKSTMKGTATHQKHRDYPRGVRQGPAFFQMDKKELQSIKQTALRPLTPVEEQLLTAQWKDLTREQKLAYDARCKQDKLRYLKELVAFLDHERERVAAQRQYDVAIDHANEPVAYVFDDPIAEPDRDSFRMRIGDRSNVEDAAVAGKASATIAFVLGHATYQNEAVTKVLLRPLTGRRHQLRLHLSHNGFPIIGDATYASPDETAPRMMLHAWRLWLMADADAIAKYGDLFFESPDPFEAIVPSQRSLTTMTR